ncbi:5-exo-hydroxycamphor dehydrogenase [Methylobacterium crusticola]|uniref:5-exo-hydroxycamphor dehydrogenase n=1 Tax=Methylobacterium crusticola TaxID=1697972 RepID=A0ABQ4R7V9_9HYPH|nr:zinc-binding dehydrogenase [Methylobacterium crusticola]GJD53477.1 5-exo-hydroxycamphor dehydrogenase [Methylobacterium crusticola]
MKGIPSASRAAVVRQFKAPVCIEEVPIPRELEPGALLTKIETCSICGTDVHLWQGSLALKVDLPVIIGHEMVGRIVAMGPGADRDSIGQDLRVGDRITWTHTSCGRCFFCTVAREPTLCQHSRKYMYECMEVFPHLLGGFAEYGYVMPDSGRVRVPDNVPNELASMASCAFRSVMNAFDVLEGVGTADTVVIQGVGPLGLLATAVARIAGARRVIALGAPDARLDLARDFGADETLSVERTSHEERLERVRALSDGRGADIVMEFTGHPDAFAEGLDLARRGGRYVVVGQLGQGTTTIKPSLIVSKNLRVLGSFSGQAKAYWKALDFVSRHVADIPFGRMVTNRYKLDDVNVALARMKAFEEIKPIIEL